MCVMIDWPGLPLLETQLDLSDRVPCLFLKDNCSEKALDRRGCLCPIDVPATLDNAGVEWEHGDGIPGFIVTDPNPNDGID